MTLRLASMVSILVLVSGCGENHSASTRDLSATTTLPVIYHLAAAASPELARDGSFLGLKFPPDGPTGLRADVGVSGTLQVLAQVPASQDITLDYQIVGIDLASLNPRIVSDVSAHGNNVGRIQLHLDGTLSIEVHLPIIGVDYDLTAYQPVPSQYPLENGHLLFRGVQLRTPFEEPYFGTPLLFLWADPVS
jgi:hypothetical protein